MSQLYIVYLDEFGHDGPFISHDHELHNTHPVFGLGGFVIPANRVRDFSHFFFKLKQNLFGKYEIPAARKKEEEAGGKFQLSNWEKKGSKQYSVANLKNYKSFLIGSTGRIINNITKMGGFLFYVGEAKKRGIEKHNPQGVYKSSLKEVIKRLDDEFKGQDAQFLIFMDDHEIRKEIVKRSIYEMHQCDKYQLLEAPVQVDSKLYQTIQCADWLCALYGKISYFDVEPESKPEYILFKQYFGDRIARAQKRSNVRNNIDRPASTQKLTELLNKFN
ncbi:TPA: DUF3800 domain-containing protein [Proteus mirabilis]|nr:MULTISPECIES: DUF3800 domain-containing protein [Proteus]DAH60123.1 MAG TPA: Protein of unknown function (DUF3800) [Caudoviricetes sp.]EMB6139672.1 DUF3800 domain-containing protein [Proteus mirabilis]MBG2796010.1 DUF3800 domain-containing protein [Proteus mirabilis]MBG3007613.1 DUF3800 domain-containing protein [Proteus mirabilis]MBG3077185.1 DUF3800 domain-containing protein [Proteus mirabilis]